MNPQVTVSIFPAKDSMGRDVFACQVKADGIQDRDEILRILNRGMDTMLNQPKEKQNILLPNGPINLSQPIR